MLPTIPCQLLVCLHCEPVADLSIAILPSLHPFDFVRNLFKFLVCVLFSFSKFQINFGGVQDVCAGHLFHHLVVDVVDGLCE